MLNRKIKMLKRNIKSFLMGGVIKDDAAIGKSRIMYEKLVLDDMRSRGYVPVLDLEPQFSITYNEKKDNYSFYLEMFGVYVGKKKSQEVEGFSGQQFYKRDSKGPISPAPNFTISFPPHFANV